MRISDYALITTLSDDDLLLVQTSSDGAYKSISVSSLKTIFESSVNGGSGGSGNNGSHPSITFTYVSDGDSEGFFYYLGTKGGTVSWTNPATNGELLNSASSFYDNNNEDINGLTDRQPTTYLATSNTPNSFYQFSISNYTIAPDYYSVRARNYAANNPTGWILKGSTDGSNWDVLDTVSGNPLAQNQWSSRPLVGVTKAYRFFQLVENGQSTSGDNIFCVGEFELYGVATHD